MLYQQQNVVLRVLVWLVGYSFCITNNGIHRRPLPHRRLYFYNPELLQHAAAGINMILPQTFYKPLPSLDIAQHLQLPHFASIGEEHEEESEEHGSNNNNKSPLQLLAFINQKNKKKKGTNMKKGKKKIKQFFKKCLPFKVRIIKKSDVYNYGDDNDNNLHYTYGNEYPNEENLALISFNTTGILSEKTKLPPVVNFLYPAYNNIVKPQPPKRILKTVTLPKKRFVRLRRPFFVRHRWRIAPPGKPIREYHLKEPIPESGGTPPRSPLYNFYSDNRIPLNENLLHQQTQINDHQLPINQSNLPEMKKYSDPDYYRYGIYDQNQFNHPLEENNETSQTTSASDSDNKYYYHSTFSSNPEKVVTVTPTTSWVPIPQITKLKQKAVEDYNFKKDFAFEKRMSKNCTYQNATKTLRCLAPKIKYSSYETSTTDSYLMSQRHSQELRKASQKAANIVGNRNNTNIEIVTAKYPEDDFNRIYSSIRNTNSVRAGRSDDGGGGGVSAVVSGSLLVKED